MREYKKIDWMITFLPMFIILLLGVLFFILPEQSNLLLKSIRFFIGDTLGTYYLLIGLGMFFSSMYFCLSKYGDVVLGEKNEKPQYSFFKWGSMMFTCGLAADILFYSLSEWIMYAINPHILELGSIQEWASVFPLFHWGFIPWSFYLVLAVAFGFMLHVRKRKRQRFSEACRLILGRQTDKILGRMVDLLAVFAVIAGTATTFSVATPLMSIIIQTLFDVSLERTTLTILIIFLTCGIYTYALVKGFKGISVLAQMCIYMFLGVIFFVLFTGGESKYIMETGFESLGRMIQNFIILSTYTDPLRKTNFPQDLTIYYWAYWMVWCVAAPFFIGSISKGRTIRQVIAGGYLFGVGSTLISFIVLGHYGLALQPNGSADFITLYTTHCDIYITIVSILESLPYANIFIMGILVTMILFYATSFDSIAYAVSCYSYRKLEMDEVPHKLIQLLWCILLILLPISLVFSESSMSNIQTVSIIAAFPIGFIMIMIVINFWQDINKYMDNI